LAGLRRVSLWRNSQSRTGFPVWVDVGYMNSLAFDNGFLEIVRVIVSCLKPKQKTGARHRCLKLDNLHKLAALICALLSLCIHAQAGAQALSAVARIDAEKTQLVDRSDALHAEFHLSQGVPFRVFTLNNPRRLVLDFREIDWTGMRSDLAEDSEAVSSVRFGVFRPGWSRMVLDLQQAMKLETADMRIKSDGTAALELRLHAIEAAEFAKISGVPENALWPEREFASVEKKDRLRLAIDPGHGGIDPGAVRDGVEEKRIALDFGKELRKALLGHEQFDVVMTRETDEFLSLRERVLSARQANADLFLSLHANTVTEGNASGATVYLLSEEASDREAAALAQKENRADIMGGVQLGGEEDAVARILVDLAQARTNMRSQTFGDLLVKGLRDTVGVIRSRPLRSAGFEVLKAPEIPSALLELGFLSNEIDRTAMQSPLWRARAIKGIIATLENWAEQDREQTTLNLQ